MTDQMTTPTRSLQAGLWSAVVVKRKHLVTNALYTVQAVVSDALKYALYMTQTPVVIIPAYSLKD